jgi:putative endonuclease
MKRYYVYILASFRRILYIGVTGNLERRLAYHRSMENPNAFTTRYAVNRLVRVEEFTDVNQAIAREKQLKRWRREKKIWLIEIAEPGLRPRRLTKVAFRASRPTPIPRLRF